MAVLAETLFKQILIGVIRNLNMFFVVWFYETSSSKDAAALNILMITNKHEYTWSCRLRPHQLLFVLSVQPAQLGVSRHLAIPIAS